MSRTIKAENREGGTKLTPYSTRRGKFRYEKISGNPHTGGSCYGNKISETSKLVTKNANRSLKKGIRQKAKLMIKQAINE